MKCRSNIRDNRVLNNSERSSLLSLNMVKTQKHAINRKIISNRDLRADIWALRARVASLSLEPPGDAYIVTRVMRSRLVLRRVIEIFRTLEHVVLHRTYRSCRITFCIF